MGYFHGFTTADTILKDLATKLTTGDVLTPDNNYLIVYPESEDVNDITDTVTLKMMPKRTKEWEHSELKTISAGNITLTGTLASDAEVRVYVRDKKYYLHRAYGSASLDVLEYRVTGSNTISVNTVLNGKEVLVSYEKVVAETDSFYIQLTKPATTSNADPNHYFLNWVIGDTYTPSTNTFAADHFSETGKLSWFREGEDAVAIGHGWLPIEYWVSWDVNAVAGMVLGDPGLSVSEWISSPFYFGSLKQIQGALATDNKGNFAGFAGSVTPPTLSKKYGDHTGTGITDVIVASSKTGRPYQAQQLAIFGGDEFRMKTFNAESAHTLKHAVSDFVLLDVHEADRGTLRHCLAVPRVGHEHGTELIYNRYVSGQEERYIFLNVNSPYLPFNTSPDVLIGYAIRTDI